MTIATYRDFSLWLRMKDSWERDPRSNSVFHYDSLGVATGGGGLIIPSLQQAYKKYGSSNPELFAGSKFDALKRGDALGTLKQLDATDGDPIFRQMYFKEHGFDKLPMALQHSVLDMSIHKGSGSVMTTLKLMLDDAGYDTKDWIKSAHQLVRDKGMAEANNLYVAAREKYYDVNTQPAARQQYRRGFMRRADGFKFKESPAEYAARGFKVEGSKVNLPDREIRDGVEYVKGSNQQWDRWYWDNVLQNATNGRNGKQKVDFAEITQPTAAPGIPLSNTPPPAIAGGGTAPVPVAGQPPAQGQVPAPVTPQAPAAESPGLASVKSNFRKMLGELTPEAFDAQYKQLQNDFAKRSVALPVATPLPENATPEQRDAHAKQRSELTDKVVEAVGQQAQSQYAAQITTYDETQASKTQQQRNEDHARSVRENAGGSGGPKTLDDMFGLWILAALGQLFGIPSLTNWAMGQMNGAGRSGYSGAGADGGRSNGAAGRRTPATRQPTGGGENGDQPVVVGGRTYKPATNFAPLQGLPGLDKKYEQLVAMGGVSPSFDPEHRKNPNGPVIILDPGHFPQRTAKNKGSSGAFVEWEEAVRAVRIQKMQLEAQGYHVIVTKHEDGSPAVVNGQQAQGGDLPSRPDVVRLAQQAYPGRVVGFLSYHFDSNNASPKTMMIVRNATPGDPSYDFAKTLADAGLNVFPDKAVVIGSDSGFGRKTGVDGLAVLNQKVAGVPHVLIEMAPTSAGHYIGKREGILANGVQGILQHTRANFPQEFAKLEPAQKALEAERAAREAQMKAAGVPAGAARALTGDITSNLDAPHTAMLDKSGGLIGGNLAFAKADPKSTSKMLTLLTLADMQAKGEINDDFFRKHAGTIDAMMQRSDNSAPYTLADATPGGREAFVKRMQQTMETHVKLWVESYGKPFVTQLHSPVGGSRAEGNSVAENVTSAAELAYAGHVLDTKFRAISDLFYKMGSNHTAVDPKLSSVDYRKFHGLDKGKTGTGNGAIVEEGRQPVNGELQSAFTGVITNKGSIAVLEANGKDERSAAVEAAARLVASGKMAPAAIAERKGEVQSLDDMYRGAGGDPDALKRYKPYDGSGVKPHKRADLAPGNVPVAPMHIRKQMLASGITYSVYVAADEFGNNAHSSTLILLNNTTGIVEGVYRATGGGKGQEDQLDGRTPFAGELDNHPDPRVRSISMAGIEVGHRYGPSLRLWQWGDPSTPKIPGRQPNTILYHPDLSRYGNRTLDDGSTVVGTSGCYSGESAELIQDLRRLGITKEVAFVILDPNIERGSMAQGSANEVPVAQAPADKLLKRTHDDGCGCLNCSDCTVPEGGVAALDLTSLLKPAAVDQAQIAAKTLLYNAVVTNDAVVATTLAVDKQNDQRAAMEQGIQLTQHLQYLTDIALAYQKERQGFAKAIHHSDDKPLLVQAVARSGDPQAEAKQAVANTSDQVAGGQPASLDDPKASPAVIAANDTSLKKAPVTISA